MGRSVSAMAHGVLTWTTEKRVEACRTVRPGGSFACPRTAHRPLFARSDRSPRAASACIACKRGMSP
jgi:hypothetical protein